MDLNYYLKGRGELPISMKGFAGAMEGIIGDSLS